jgi:DNA mismatch endonuclease (patch repair protein)
LAWIGRRVAVFVDGAFWHGHPDHYWGQSGKFWDDKIARNRARDQTVNEKLAAAGWTVVRLWDFEVERDLPACISRVGRAFHRHDAGDTESHPARANPE